MDRIATPTPNPNPTPTEPIPCTLLELVLALDELTEDEGLTELLAHDLLDSGQVVLTGNFRGQSLH